MEKTIELFVGIDVAKHKVDVHFYPIGEKHVFENDDAGLSALVVLLLERKPKRVVFESTGGYGRRLAQALRAGHVKAHCVPAQRIRKFAEAIGENAKTDEIDAGVIAHFASTAKLYDPVEPTAAEQRLKELVVRRTQLIKLRGREKNHRETMSEKFVDSWNNLQDALDAHIDQLEKAMLDVVNNDVSLTKKAHVLSTIKGCAFATSCAFMALMPELGKLPGKKAAALVGVAPFNDDSGQTKKGERKRKISGGRGRLREVLFMSSLSAAQWNPDLHPIYERLIKKGKPLKVAQVAVMNKLVVIANARLRDALGEVTPTEVPQTWKPRLQRTRRAAA